MDKKLIKAYLPWGLCAGIFTIAAASGLFYEMDNRLSDALYQERRGTDGRIAIVGIDQRSLEALGPFGTWDRRILAQTVSYLNQGISVLRLSGWMYFWQEKPGQKGIYFWQRLRGPGKMWSPQQREPLVPLWLQRRTAPFIWMILP